MNKLKRLTSRGDTIIEVMIVLTVLSLALSISYATASRSLTNARQAQENTEATTIAQSQIERLRHNFKVTDTLSTQYIYRVPSTQTFCINPSGDVKLIPNAECKIGELYNVSTSYDGGSTFTVTVIWDDLSGNGQSSVKLSYRLHKP